MARSKVFSGSPKQIAEEFLKNNAELFGLEKNLIHLKFDTVITYRGYHHVGFRQTFDQVYVKGGGYTVHISSDDRVMLVNGGYFSNIEIASVRPSINSQMALEIAKTNLGTAGKLKKAVEPKLLILPQKNKKGKLAWSIIVRTEKPIGSWRFLIDALTGDVLDKQNLVCFVTGQGKVYPKHPNISSVTQVNLPRLDGSGYIKGTYVEVYNSQPSGEAYDPNLSFLYDTSNVHFDEVNAYYHVDKFRYEYINNLGFTGNGIDPVIVNVHDESQANRPAFNPDDLEIYLSSGLLQGQNDFAKEDKVIYHEYTHAMVYSIQQLTSSYSEEGAINEGLGDYFAGSFTDRSAILEYSAPNEIRNMANPRYSHLSEIPYQGGIPDPSVDIHFVGEFFSACLWDLRNHVNVGQTIGDDLIYNAIWFLPNNPTFIDFREELITYDSENYSGVHVPYIECVFSNRGIGSAPVTNSGTLACNESWSGTINISGDVTVPTGVTLTIQPGTTINFPQNTGLTINGKLTAIGTSSNRIIFSGNEWPYWSDGIIFNDASDNSSQISYATINGFVYGIKCYKANPKITWNLIAANQYGVHVTNASPTIKYNVIKQNTGSTPSYTGNGIYVWASGYDSPTITNNRIYNNTFGIQFVAVAQNPAFFHNDIYDNRYNFFGRDYTAWVETWSGNYNNFYFLGTEWDDVGLRNTCLVYLTDNWWDEYPADNGEFDLDATSGLAVFPELFSPASHTLPKGAAPETEERQQLASNEIKEFKLFQNYPNPFNPSTMIKFQIPAGVTGNVILKVYNLLGEEVANLVNQNMSAGLHEVFFDASNLSSGIYFYVLRAGKYHSVNKMIYLR